MIWSLGNPVVVDKVVTRSSRHATSPAPLVPIQRVPSLSRQTDRSRPAGSPSFFVSRVALPSFQRTRPFPAPAQTVPSGASARDQTVPCPSSSPRTCRKTPSLYWTTFSLRPIQSVPRRSSMRANADPVARRGVVLPSNTVKRAPSNRTRPSYVPNQRWPSRVLRIDVTVFWGRPFSVCQMSTWAWVRGRSGRSAAEEAGRKSGDRSSANPNEPPPRSPRFRSASSRPFAPSDAVRTRTSPASMRRRPRERTDSTRRVLPQRPLQTRRRGPDQKQNGPRSGTIPLDARAGTLLPRPHLRRLPLPAPAEPGHQPARPRPDDAARRRARHRPSDRRREHGHRRRRGDGPGARPRGRIRVPPPELPDRASRRRA